jgi:predicted protein tyrosine phosphatase
MKLSNREWKSFRIYDIFNHQRGKRQIAGYRQKGNIPYYSASKDMNGLTDFISNPKFIINTNAIIYSTFGDAYCVNKNFSTSDEITILTNEKLNKYNGLFIVQALKQNKQKYSFGRKAFSNKITKDKILLPTKNDQLDYQFMENYTKSLYQKKLQKYINYIKKQLSKIEYKEIPKLQEKKWKEFFIIDIFPNIQRGKRLTKTKQTKGNIPYVSSTAQNNGVDNFIGNLEKVRIFEDCLTIANSGSVGATFYHSYKFVASDHVTHLKNEKFNSFIYLFISTLTKRLSTKYNFNREINDFRISRDKILLPINDKNKPDYEYMEQYIKNLMFKKINQYLKFVEKKKESFSD